MKEYEGYTGPLSREEYYGKDREKLGFKETVFHHFKFLVEEYGFRCVSSGLLHVEYESKKVFVGVYHERLSDELEIRVGLLKQENMRGYTLQDILLFKGKDDLYQQLENKRAEHVKYLGASTAEEVRKYVPIIAELLREYALPAIQGNPGFYEQLDKSRRR
ncbi:MAG: hypothetical protein PVJ08_05870 [Dehalococcoidia bacterium]